MKALFDLRAKKDDEILDAIKNIYEEPLKTIRLEDRSITACMGC